MCHGANSPFLIFLTMKSLLIIGAGPGGYECAVRAAKAGLDVHIADNAAHLGGTCLNEGCIPTKCLCHTAEVLETVKEAAAYGIGADLSGFDLAAAMRRKDGVVAQLQQGIRTLLGTAGITFHDGWAQFSSIGGHTVTIGGEELTFDYIIIATGSSPKFLPIPGAHTPGVVTSTELLQVNAVPPRLCIIGGGVIGLEFASVFNSFGSKVMVIEFCKEVLPNFDRDVAKRLRGAMKKRGVEFITGAPVTAIHADEERGRELHVSYEHRSAVHDAVADLVLMAVGRTPNVASLNIDAAGIAQTPRGIVVDENMMTNVAGVYAVGDVNGLCQLAHAATFQSYRALSHILGEEDATPLNLVPAAVFTTPEAAIVGLTEEQAQAAETEYVVKKAFFRTNGRALAMDAAGDGLLKLLLAPDGKLLGAHILGPHASEMIHELAVAMRLGATFNDLRQTIHAHPTLSELILAAS